MCIRERGGWRLIPCYRPRAAQEEKDAGRREEVETGAVHLQVKSYMGKRAAAVQVPRPAPPLTIRYLDFWIWIFSGYFMLVVTGVYYSYGVQSECIVLTSYSWSFIISWLPPLARETACTTA